MLKLSARPCEILSDCVLGFLFVLPPIAIASMLIDCSHLDGVHARCSTSVLEVFANALPDLVGLMVSGGYILYLPIVAAAYFISMRTKYRAWKAGTLRIWSFGVLVWLLASCLIALLATTTLPALIEARMGNPG